MRVVCMSDTHNLHVYHRGNLVVPDGDVLVHCGDATMRGSYEEVALFATWFAAFPHKHKVFVPGNHDWGFYEAHKAWEETGSFADLAHIDWAHVLIDREVVIDGVKFWGSPWQPAFMDWAWNLPRGPALKAHWDLIPTDTDVLVTHSPPLGHLDEVWRFKNEKRYIEHVGCADMRMAADRIKPKFHVFGHVHGAYGTKQVGDTTFINCASADERYYLKHAPMIFDIEKGKE